MEGTKLCILSSSSSSSSSSYSAHAGTAQSSSSSSSSSSFHGKIDDSLLERLGDYDGDDSLESCLQEVNDSAPSSPANHAQFILDSSGDLAFQNDPEVQAMQQNGVRADDFSPTAPARSDTFEDCGEIYNV